MKIRPVYFGADNWTLRGAQRIQYVRAWWWRSRERFTIDVTRAIRLTSRSVERRTCGFCENQRPLEQIDRVHTIKAFAPGLRESVTKRRNVRDFFFFTPQNSFGFVSVLVHGIETFETTICIDPPMSRENFPVSQSSACYVPNTRTRETHFEHESKSLRNAGHGRTRRTSIRTAVTR